MAQRADEIATEPGAPAGWRWRSASCTSIVAALIPARQAARVDPVQALQKGKYQVLSAGESRLRGRWPRRPGGGVGRAACWPATSRPVFYVGYVLAIVVALLLGPLLSLALARALRPVLKWLRPVEGALAADSLIQAPRRTSASVAALMLSLALVVAFAGMARASYDSIIDWMDTALNPDLFVMPSQDIVDPDARGFRRRWAPELAAVPGVERVQTVRDARIVFRQTPVMIVATDIAQHRGDGAPRTPVAGDADDDVPSDGGGRGLMVSDNLAQLQQLTLGEIARDSGAARRHPAADRRHRRRLLRSAGHDPDGPHGLFSSTGTTTR